MNYQEASDLLDRTSVMPVAPIKAERWVNIMFSKDGRSLHGVLVHPTEAAAFADLNNAMNDPLCNIFTDGKGFIKKRDVSFVLQMPVTE